jgi:hypothetical protein
MKRLLLALILMAVPLAAQQGTGTTPLVNVGATPEPKVPTVQKLFLLKYADPSNLQSLLGVFNVRIQANREMRALTVDAPKETMAAIEDVIKRLDVPSAASTNVDMTVYLLVGYEGDNPSGSASVPKDLDSVVTQLKNAFAFKNYSLMDVLALRTGTGQRASTTSSGGAIQFLGRGSEPVTTSFSIRSATIGGDGTTVRIDSLQSNSKVPVATGGNGISYQDLGISTNIDIKEGQKVVVGRLGISKDQALFLVMTVKIVP